MGTCKICGKKSTLISIQLGLCLDCIRCCAGQAREIALKVHARIRDEWGLPGHVPRNPEGIALTGVTNRRTLENFELLTKWIPKRPEPPFLIASTLMVPGYIDAREVGRIADFIQSLDPEIPYSLLAFHPQYKMTDLPATSRNQARECLDAAQHAGLKRVRVGNTHLLW